MKHGRLSRIPPMPSSPPTTDPALRPAPVWMALAAGWLGAVMLSGVVATLIVRLSNGSTVTLWLAGLLALALLAACVQLLRRSQGHASPLLRWLAAPSRALLRWVRRSDSAPPAWALRLVQQWPGTAVLVRPWRAASPETGPDWQVLAVGATLEASPQRLSQWLPQWHTAHPEAGPAPRLATLQGENTGGWQLIALGEQTAAAPLMLLWRAPAAPLPDAAESERESIAYSVSHDLRAPIRVIEGFTRIVREDYGPVLDRVGRDHLDRVLGAATRMNHMIDALIALSRLSTQPLSRQRVPLSELAAQILDDLRRQAPERVVQASIEPNLVVQGDPTLLYSVLENLLGNAWKYSARRSVAQIEFGCTTLREIRPLKPGEVDRPVYYLRDNGAGFDMRFADRLFGAFQRLHSASEFSGTGVGLASVRRIVRRHGGEIWAQSAVDQGSCFFFTLG